MTPELTQQLKEFRADAAAHSLALAETRRTFEHLIMDKSIPLDDRWEFWCQAPKDLKLHKDSIQSFRALPNRWDWYSDYNLERRSVVDMEEFVCNLQEGVLDPNARYEGYDERLYNPETVVKLKEDILGRNLVSWLFEW